MVALELGFQSKLFAMGVDPLNIAIVGCGIGGLSAAIGMAKVGHKVMIFERTSKITQVLRKSNDISECFLY